MLCVVPGVQLSSACLADLPLCYAVLLLDRVGPQPLELGGQRALDFVLDNPTLQDFNRTLLFDIKLLSVRKAK
jgi:hypothetical protein